MQIQKSVMATCLLVASCLMTSWLLLALVNGIENIGQTNLICDQNAIVFSVNTTLVSLSFFKSNTTSRLDCFPMLRNPSLSRLMISESDFGVQSYPTE